MTAAAEGAVPLREVERELSRQTRTLHGARQGPVLTARMANLVIYCGGPEQAARVEAVVPDVVAVHPARVLLLTGAEGERELTAEVTVRPVRTGPGVFACSEQVTLRAGGVSVERLPFAVRALLIGDLPTNLWWAAPTPPPLAGPLLHELAEYAQQIMFDSIGWPDPARGVAATAPWLEGVERCDGGGRWRVASDLNWRRLKYWRRMLTQALDPGSAPGAAEAVTEVVAEHGPHAVVQAWELVSWLAGRLGWRYQRGKRQDGSEFAWRFEGGRGGAVARVRRLPEGAAELHRVRLNTRVGGRACVINLQQDGPERLALTLEGQDAAARTLTLPPHLDAELVGRQLSDRDRDPVFREAMTVAAGMARSVLG